MLMDGWNQVRVHLHQEPGGTPPLPRVVTMSRQYTTNTSVKTK